MHIETHGCAFNASDSEVMAGLLERAGHVIADSPDAADAVIVNSCTVKDRTYLDFRRRVRELSAAGAGRGPVLILAGCVPRVPEQARESDACFSRRNGSAARGCCPPCSWPRCPSRPGW